MKLIFATHNQNKLREVKSLIPETIQLLSLDDIDYHSEIDETAETIEGNALLKARTISRHTGLNCFADDSGLLVDALNGAPGVYSAQYAGEQKDDEANIQKLLHELSTKENRSAHFKTVMALVLNDSEMLFEGIMQGSITKEKKGNHGFGYDPVFKPKGYDQTFAEMESAVKNAISHRGKALKKLIAFLNSGN